MNICGLEKISLVDYDGYVATTIFCCGCDFACPFCHNGGLVNGTQQIIPQEEVFAYLDQRKKLLDAIVVSGGEPTLQKDLLSFLQRLNEYGLKIKLDTNGNNYPVLKNVIDQNLVNYVAMDVKNSESSYALTTGIKNLDFTNVKNSIELLKKGRVDYEFRTTLVKELHTTESITEMAKLLQGAKRLYLQKFKPAETCLQKGLTEVPKDTALNYAEILKKSIPNVKLRGYQ